MIDLVLVIGFLGSGKTTLLKRIHKQNIGRKLVFLVNEFSVKDVNRLLASLLVKVSVKYKYLEGMQ